MNLKTNQLFVFHFWQNNDFLLTETSTSFKECSVKNSYLALVGMSIFIKNCILNTTGHYAFMIIGKHYIASVF